jgi:hypothetical protein
VERWITLRMQAARATGNTHFHYFLFSDTPTTPHPTFTTPPSALVLLPPLLLPPSVVWRWVGGCRYGVVTDNQKGSGKPVVQGPSDPAPGFYVSSTSYQDPTKKATDPRRYVDASTVPYAVLPSNLQSAKVKGGAKMGDYATIINPKTGAVCVRCAVLRRAVLCCAVPCCALLTRPCIGWGRVNGR